MSLLQHQTHSRSDLSFAATLEAPESSIAASASSFSNAASRLVIAERSSLAAPSVSFTGRLVSTNIPSMRFVVRATAERRPSEAATQSAFCCSRASLSFVSYFPKAGGFKSFKNESRTGFTKLCERCSSLRRTLQVILHHQFQEAAARYSQVILPHDGISFPQLPQSPGLSKGCFG